MGFLGNIFYKLGLATAQRPGTTCFIGLLVLMIGSIGFVNEQLTSDPQELWVPPNSRANIEQTYFTEQFGAFFRIDTAWIVPYETAQADHDIFQKPYLNLLYYLQKSIEDGFAESNDLEFSVHDLCYKPISGQDCIVESPMQYFKMNITYLNEDTTDPKVVAQCIPPPDQTERTCFDRIGTPVLTYAVFGGLSCEPGTSGACAACKIDASGLQLTFLLNNNAYSNGVAEEWERQVFIRNIKSFNHAITGYNDAMDNEMAGIDYNDDLIAQIKAVYAENPDMIQVKMDYLAERSIQDDIVLEGQQNTAIVLISYTLMFLYVSMAIGFFPNPVHTKFALGAVGIFVVIASLLTGIGFTFYFNQKLTMISAEVVPFLILAIGVDNMFLISRAEREVPAEVTQVDKRIAYALKEIGPSIFTAAFCEAIAFFIGMLTDVPALKSFCLVAGLGVIFDFILQLTIFVPALTLDNHRIRAKRGDIICCFKKYDEVETPRQEIVRTAFRKYFVPWLMNPCTKVLVLLMTIALLIIGGMSCSAMLLGLNQNVSLVEGSDIYDYFETLYTYGEAGPPAYLVFNNVNYSNPDNLVQMNLIASELATLNDTVQSPIYSWVSPFQNFIDDSGAWADVCGSDRAAILGFDDQMAEFVNIKVDSDCCQSYGICGEQFSLDVIFDDDGHVSATRFRWQHQPLKTQEDYINGLVETRRATDIFAQSLTANDYSTTASDAFMDEMKPYSYYDHMLYLLGYEVEPFQLKVVANESEAPLAFCYSLYYVYYDQYTYIRGVLFQNVLIGIGAIIVSIQVLSSLSIAFFIALAVFFVFFELMGFCWMLNIIMGGYPIEINAVFVVNLVTSLGFGVEFCNHIGMNFMYQRGTRDQRIRKALNEMGSSVVVGIASTKFLGVLVLAFAPSTLFRIYYFRMYLLIIILGAFNGLLVLPVLLSLIGPSSDEEEIREREESNILLKQEALKSQ